MGFTICETKIEKRFSAHLIFESPRQSTWQAVGIFFIKSWQTHRKVGKLDQKVGKLDQKVGRLKQKVGKLKRKVGKLIKKVGILGKNMVLCWQKKRRMPTK